MKECPVCLCDEVDTELPCHDVDAQGRAGDHHAFCRSCLLDSFTHDIEHGKLPLQCLGCDAEAPHAVVDIVLGDENELRAKYERLALLRSLQRDPNVRFCPQPGCTYAVECDPDTSRCPELTCPICDTHFCYRCRERWHAGEPCVFAVSEQVKPCPNCGAMIYKEQDGSCNQMKCSICSVDFCWLCLQVLSGSDQLGHFLSLSGCTFYGKQRWSKRKQRAWQLSTPVTAPLAIAGAAAAASFAIFIAPVAAAGDDWRLSADRPKPQRVARVIGTVVGTTIVFPPVAGIGLSLFTLRLLAFAYVQLPVREGVRLAKRLGKRFSKRKQQRASQVGLTEPADDPQPAAEGDDLVEDSDQTTHV
eukprot:m.168885 g.168885  ORF g.168885 m.168885 type:complete len:360 (+) comp17796_c3_seq6:3017-4096(+)